MIEVNIIKASRIIHCGDRNIELTVQFELKERPENPCLLERDTTQEYLEDIKQTVDFLLGSLNSKTEKETVKSSREGC